jgi:hypothetical protein
VCFIKNGCLKFTNKKNVNLINRKEENENKVVESEIWEQMGSVGGQVVFPKVFVDPRTLCHLNVIIVGRSYEEKYVSR